MNKVLAENLTKVLYPEDAFSAGKELRLKQEDLLVSCTIQDILRRFKSDGNAWETFPDKVFVQLNDTHPALVIPELMRLLMDREGLEWDKAWHIATASTGYMLHPPCSKRWRNGPSPCWSGCFPGTCRSSTRSTPASCGKSLAATPDEDRLRRMSIIEESEPKQVRMAHLAIVGSSSVNGVSELHTNLLRTKVLHDFAEYWPSKFNNKTNGITPRRWLLKANPPLAQLITDAIGDR